MSKVFYKNYSFWLIIITLLILGVSVYAHQIDNFGVYRGLRLLPILGALVFLILRKPKIHRWWMLLFLVLYGVSSALTIGYEISLLAVLSMLFNMLAFWVLIVTLFPKINFRKMNMLFSSIFIIMVLLNAYLLYEFVNMIKEFAQNTLHYLFMMLGAMSLVAAGFFALVYNHLNSSRVSIVFTVFVFTLIFAEVFRAIAYYDFAYGDISVYIARLLNIISMALLIHFAIISARAKVSLAQSQEIEG
ncbi:MAG: hypothetical protein HKN48_12975 [Flavobacteriaceae bacterium]|nr:hypothetical protein [Flavobacteriaceae bacterium]